MTTGDLKSFSPRGFFGFLNRKLETSTCLKGLSDYLIYTFTWFYSTMQNKKNYYSSINRCFRLWSVHRYTASQNHRVLGGYYLLVPTSFLQKNPARKVMIFSKNTGKKKHRKTYKNHQKPISFLLKSTFWCLQSSGGFLLSRLFGLFGLSSRSRLEEVPEFVRRGVWQQAVFSRFWLVWLGKVVESQ